MPSLIDRYLRGVINFGNQKKNKINVTFGKPLLSGGWRGTLLAEYLRPNYFGFVRFILSQQYVTLHDSRISSKLRQQVELYIIAFSSFCDTEDTTALTSDESSAPKG